MIGLRAAAVRVVERLRSEGHAAYWAGGCVRDLVMKRTPKDYDIATSARPEDVMAIFPRAIPVGVSFGVVRVVSDEYEFEVATFRSDGNYRDGRHPESVTFGGEEEDARRRDFTINGLFFDPTRERLIDYVSGVRDIEARVVRTIGDPTDRFSEDRLRLIRAVRFAAALDFRLDGETENAIRRLAGTVMQVSGERVRDELAKILTGPRSSDSIRLLQEVGLLAVLLPEVEATRGIAQPPEFHPEGDVFVHTLLLLEQFDTPSFELALAGLLHDIGKPPTFSIRDRIRFDGHCEVGARMTAVIAHRLRLSNRQTDHVTALVRDHLKFKDVRLMRESTLKRFLRQPYFEDHLALHRADCLASHGDLSHWEFCRERLASLPIEAIRPPRLLTGDDLIGMGYSPGRQFTEILRQVEDAQLEGRLTSRDAAVSFVLSRFPVADQGRRN